MMEMGILMILAGLASSCTGQLIYPDQYDALIASARPPQPPQAKQAFALQAPVFTNALNFSSNFERAPVFSNAFGAFSGPADNSPESSPVIPLGAVQDQEVNDVISKGIVKFALDMNNAVSNVQGRSITSIRENVIFSPLSVANALALVLLGSGGRTFDEVSKILGLASGVDVKRNSELVHKMFGALLSSVDSRTGKPGPQAAIASGIFVQNGYPIRPEFRAISKNVYKSDVINLDFMNRGGDAERAIDSWVRDNTMGKIKKILGGIPDPETRVIIASALYFNGEWNQYFFDGATRRKPFNVAPGQTIDVDMMYNGGEFPFFEDKRLQAKIVGLPYKGGEATMYVVLPTAKDPGALGSLERRLSVDILENLIQNMKNQTCILGIPRMKLSSTLSLSDALQSLGLNSLFDPVAADLSLLSPGYDSATLGASKGEPGPAKPTQGSQEPQKLPNDVSFIFPPRLKEDNDRQNYFRYEDKAGGYSVEQWAMGFSIRRIKERARRSLMRANDLLGRQKRGLYLAPSGQRERILYEECLERERSRRDSRRKRSMTKKELDRQKRGLYLAPANLEGQWRILLQNCLERERDSKDSRRWRRSNEDPKERREDEEVLDGQKRGSQVVPGEPKEKIIYEECLEQERNLRDPKGGRTSARFDDRQKQLEDVFDREKPLTPPISEEQWKVLHERCRKREGVSKDSTKRRGRSRTQEKGAYNIPHDNDDLVQVVGLGESKYRFEKQPQKTTGRRSRRQIQPIDRNFVNSQNLPNYNLDNLRNSGNLPNPGLFADDVLHKVEIDVTEKGTEAAAATAVILTKTGNQKRLVADKPFLFFIRNESTKLLLFWGAVNKPTPNYPSG